MQIERDHRLDFFRGLALYIILVDHIGGNPIARYTYHRFGFSDAAEAFVFLSGVSCGLALPAYLERHGAVMFWRNITGRVLRLYGYYVATSIAVIALIFATAEPLLRAGALRPLWQTFAADPTLALQDALLLRTPPTLPLILILYMITTFAVAPAFVFCARYSRALALSISAAIWVVPQMGILGSDKFAEVLFFNPLAWQFLFCIGMAFGISSRSGAGWPRTRLGSVGVAGAWAIVLGCLALRLFPALGLSSLGADAAAKSNLHVARLVHFLAVVVLIAAHLGKDARVYRLGKETVLHAGRFSLEVFAFGTFVSEAGTVLFATVPLSFTAKMACNVAVIGATALLVAWLWERKARRVVAPRHSAAPSLPGLIARVRGGIDQRSALRAGQRKG